METRVKRSGELFGKTRFSKVDMLVFGKRRNILLSDFEVRSRMSVVLLAGFGQSDGVNETVLT